jgi:hypothetical protein
MRKILFYFLSVTAKQLRIPESPRRIGVPRCRGLVPRPLYRTRNRGRPLGHAGWRSSSRSLILKGV